MLKKTIEKSLKTLRKEGVLVFLKKSLNFAYFKTPLLHPLFILKLKFIKTNDKNKLFDYAMNLFGGLISPMQIKEEFVSLLKLVEEKKPKIVLEIGTAKGGTLFCLSRILPDDSTLISIDLPNGEFGGGYPGWKKFLYMSFATKKQKIILLRADSHKIESCEKVKQILGNNKIDFLFIDADHTYEGVERDFKLYSSLVKKGGVIALHDVAKCLPEDKCKVEKFWSQIKNNYKHKEFISTPDQKKFGIGVICDFE